MLSGRKKRQQQPFAYISDDSYTALILEETEKLYNTLKTELTNRVMAVAAASVSASSLPLPAHNNNRN